MSKTFQKIFEKGVNRVVFEFRIETREWAVLRINLVNLYLHYQSGFSFTPLDLQILCFTIAIWWDNTPYLDKT